jgi:GT2 family glycosyltransferase
MNNSAVMNKQVPQIAASDEATVAVTATPSPLYAIPCEGSHRLRVTLVAPLQMPIWLARFVELATQSGWIDLVVLPVIGEQPQPAIADVPVDMRAYLALDRVRRRHSRTLESVALDQRDGVILEPAIQFSANVAPLRTRIAALRPDLILLLGTDSWATALADRAKWGCWRLDASLIDIRCAGVSLLESVLQGESATAVELELEYGETKPVNLAMSWGASWPGSFNLQRDQAFLKLPALLMRALRRLTNGEMTLPPGQLARLRLAPTRIPLRFGAGLRAFAITLRHIARWQVQKRRPEDPWILLLRHGSEPLDPSAPALGPNSALIARRDDQWADPCIVEDAGRRLLFAEEYAPRTDKAVIVCLELMPDGNAKRLGIVLDEPFHLSYPQAFTSAGQWYLTVESGAARRVSLYRASAFPFGWQRLTDLVSGYVCVDPTLHHHEGHWYLFVNVSESGGSTCDELFLFVADELTGPFRPHPLNPIVSDVRRARPAGRLFNHGARLIRPGQDCAASYGAAIVFNEVLELSPTRYIERPLSRLDASGLAGLNSCHTYSAVNEVEVLDSRGYPPGDMVTLDITDAPVVCRDHFGSTPLVSVIIPTCNAEHFLGQAIDSALTQTFGNLEVIVVNDGSTDGSGALADGYAATHTDRLRVVHQDNLGVPLARNAGIAVARGRYIAILDPCEVWLPGHIEACVTLLEHDSGIGLVHANSQALDSQGYRVGTAPHWGRRAREGRDPYAEILLGKQHIAGSTAVFRRSIIDAIGPFDALFNHAGCDDRDMWLRIAEVAGVVHIEEVHALYRISADSGGANQDLVWHARRQLVAKHVARPRGRPLHRRALAAIDAARGRELATEGPLLAALAAFVRAIARDPLRADAWGGLIRRVLAGRRWGVALPR